MPRSIVVRFACHSHCCGASIAFSRCVCVAENLERISPTERDRSHNSHHQHDSLSSQQACKLSNTRTSSSTMLSSMRSIKSASLGASARQLPAALRVPGAAPPRAPIAPPAALLPFSGALHHPLATRRWMACASTPVQEAAPAAAGEETFQYQAEVSKVALRLALSAGLYTHSPMLNLGNTPTSQHTHAQLHSCASTCLVSSPGVDPASLLPPLPPG